MTGRLIRFPKAIVAARTEQNPPTLRQAYTVSSGVHEAWLHWVDAWLRTLQAAGRPATTVYLRQHQLSRLARGLAGTHPWQVTGQQLVDWLAEQDWQRETRRSWRSAIRGFYGWAYEAGHVDVDPSRALPKVDPRPPRPRPAPREAYRAAIAGADDRVLLMLRCAAELGMRRGEVARLHRDDLEHALNGWSVRVVGKGERVRHIPIDDCLAAAIRRAGTGYVFPGAVDGHLSPAWVGRLVSRALPGAWTMHTLRHRFATVAYSVDRDTFVVQQLLGHASPVTTRLYVQVPDDALRRTVAAVAAAS